MALSSWLRVIARVHTEGRRLSRPMAGYIPRWFTCPRAVTHQLTITSLGHNWTESLGTTVFRRMWNFEPSCGICGIQYWRWYRAQIRHMCYFLCVSKTCKLWNDIAENYKDRFWLHLPNIIKIDPYNFELYRFKVCVFFLRHSVAWMNNWLTSESAVQPWWPVVTAGSC